MRPFDHLQICPLLTIYIMYQNYSDSDIHRKTKKGSIPFRAFTRAYYTRDCYTQSSTWLLPQKFLLVGEPVVAKYSPLVAKRGTT